MRRAAQIVRRATLCKQRIIAQDQRAQFAVRDGGELLKRLLCVLICLFAVVFLEISVDRACRADADVGRHHALLAAEARGSDQAILRREFPRDIRAHAQTRIAEAAV